MMMKSKRYELTIVRNPNHIWGFLSLQRLFTKNGNDPSEERDVLLRAHEELFQRFRSLARISGKAEFHGNGNVRSNGVSVRCIRVRLLEAGSSEWTEELWIDPGRRLVVKAIIREPLRVPEKGLHLRTIHWTKLVVDEPIDSRIFEFSPPEGARRTNAIELRDW